MSVNLPLNPVSGPDLLIIKFESRKESEIAGFFVFSYSYGCWVILGWVRVNDCPAGLLEP